MASPPLIRMIFGMEVSPGRGPITLTISGSFGAPEPALAIRRRGDENAIGVAWSKDGWSIALDPGDYIVTLPVERWVPGLLTIDADGAGGDEPALVYYGDLPDLGVAGLAAWRASQALVDPPATSLSDDPKDPWPPPPPPELRVKVAASAWFEAELLAAWTQTQNDLARNGGRAAPSLD